MKRVILLTAVAAILIPIVARADEPTRSRVADKPNLKTLTEKRAWLRQEAVKGVQDRQKAVALQAVINDLRPKQIDELLQNVLAQQLPAPDARDAALRLAEWELQRAIAIRRALEAEYWRRYGYGVGYMPVVTWLPQGTSMGASAVISPDRRYVRVNTQPFFSSIGPVYTYNWRTGETRLQEYPSGRYPNRRNVPLGYPTDYSGYRTGQLPPQHLPPPAPSHLPNKVWYDGLRTRVSR